MPPGGGGYPAPTQYGAQQQQAPSQGFGFGAAPTATQGFGGGFGGAPQQGYGAPYGAQQAPYNAPAQAKPAASFNPFDM